MDLSPMDPVFSDYELTKTKLTVDGMFGDAYTAQAFEAAKNHFFKMEKTDKKQTMTTGVKIQGMSPGMLVRHDDAEVPWWISRHWMYAVSCIGCACVFKCCFEGRAGRLTYTFQKKIYCLPNQTPQSIQQGRWQPPAHSQAIAFKPTLYDV